VNLRVVITADDRTGALETAGLCADTGAGPLPVVVRGTDPAKWAEGLCVIDIASRHLSPADAEAVAADTCRSAARHLHKMDSTLRGNWAAEARAIGRARHERVLVVPALPILGRVCAGGIVSVDGVAVHEGPLAADPRSPVRSSRPADHLRLAGASDVDELAGVDDIGRWLADDDSSRPRGAVAVCDAVTDADVRSIVSSWAQSDGVVLVGTSVVVAEAVQALRSGAQDAPVVAPSFVTPVLVVCGSLHPAARAQVETLRRARLEGVDVIASEVPAPGSVVDEDAARTVAALAMVASLSEARTIVVLGGDTAAAVLGDRPVVVGGISMPGAPWMRLDDGRLVVTRAGGFGDPAALVRHIADRIGS
jgi:4-hydroxythreonine-4-phosphate dehydrogenase